MYEIEDYSKYKVRYILRKDDGTVFYNEDPYKLINHFASVYGKDKRTCINILKKQPSGTKLHYEGFEVEIRLAE